MDADPATVHEDLGRSESHKSSDYWLAHDSSECRKKNKKKTTHSEIADGAISSKFSMLHSSKNSKIGEGWLPTDIYAMSAKFFTRPV